MPRRPLLSRFRSQVLRYYLRSKHLFAEVPVPRRSTLVVRRGPRASATSLVTVSLAESEAVLLTQQAPVRRGPRASANSLVTVLMASVLPNLRYYLRSKHLFAEVPVPRRPLLSRFRSQNPKRTPSSKWRLRKSCSYPQSPRNLKTKELDLTELLFDVMCIEKTSFFYDFSWF